MTDQLNKSVARAAFSRFRCAALLAAALAALPFQTACIFWNNHDDDAAEGAATSGLNDAAPPAIAAEPTDRPSRRGGSGSTGAVAEVDQAKQLAEAGLSDAALDLLNKAIERNPTLTTAHLTMGQIYEERNDFTSAERAYGQAARVEPTNFDAQYKHGFSLHMLNRLTDAVRAYLRALAIRPDDFEANLNIATAYLELGEPRQAYSFADKAASLQPNSGAARANLGAAIGELADNDARLGNRAEAERQYRQAIREFEAAAEFMEPTPELLLNLANTLGKVERFAEMQATLETLVRTQPTAASWERLGFARFRQNNLAGAQQAFSNALNLDPRHYPAINGLAVCHLNTWHSSNFADTQAKAEALALLRDSLRVQPNQPRIDELLQRYK